MAIFIEMKTHVRILFCLLFACNLKVQAQKKYDFWIQEFCNYTPEDITYLKSDSCGKIESWFQRDLERGDLFLFIFDDSSGQDTMPSERFANKYDVNYYFLHSNCFIGMFMGCVAVYNSLVFEHLTTQFGKSWKNEVRRDVYDFVSWKRRKRIQKRQEANRNDLP